MDVGSRLLIKFDDNSVLELKTGNKIGPYSYKIKDGEVYVDPSYNVSEAQLKEIASKKATKIRVEYLGGYFDRYIDANKFSIGIKYFYEAINSTLDTPNDIHLDF